MDDSKTALLGFTSGLLGPHSFDHPTNVAIYLPLKLIWILGDDSATHYATISPVSYINNASFGILL